MNGWSVAFLGLIAAATVVMAVIQVGAVLFAARLARRLERLAAVIERDIKPVLENVTAVSAGAARTASLAAAQAERADRLFADLSQRVDETAAVIQTAIVTPVREVRALVTAVGAALAALREIKPGNRPRRAPVDDEDPLFIG